LLSRPSSTVVGLAEFSRVTGGRGISSPLNLAKN
jgi:hypothetical protein